MKLFYKLIILFIILFFVKTNKLFAQESNNKVKVQYIYRFAQNIDWNKTTIKDTFYIAYLGRDDEFSTYLKMIERKSIHKHPTKVLIYNNIKDIDYTRLHLVYIDKEYNSDHFTLFDNIKNSNILMISDNFAQKKFIMINFIYPDDKTISFEVNSKTIEEQNLQVNPNLLLLGGTDIDIKKLYKEQEEELNKERENVEKQKQEIAKLNKNIAAKQAELIQKEKIVAAKEKELKIQTAKLAEQKKILAKIESEVLESKRLLNAKNKDLKQKEIEILTQKELIARQNEKVENAKKELLAVNNEIKRKKEELKQKEAEIAKKEKELSLKDSTINAQKQWIIIGGSVLLLILILSILLIKMIRDRNAANKQLEYQNIEINNKNLEINSQKEELEKQKTYIEEQFRETQASITYAKTIQTAILPTAEDIGKYFKNFILFRPKDVVSGDFFWIAHLPAKENLTEKVFIAAVDCTGHGVPGAFMSMIGNRLLNEIVNEKKITNTANILEALNEAVFKSLKQGESENRDGMDLCLCRIEKKEDGSKLLSFTGAKRPVYIYKKEEGKLISLAGDRKSIGGSVFRNSNKIKFTVQEENVSEGDMVYLSTDGYIDQNNTERKRFGTSRFTKILSKIALSNIKKQKETLENELDAHQKGTEQRDDITVIGIKI